MNKQRLLEELDEEKEKLNKIGFIWDIDEQAWSEGLAELKRYKEEHGDCMLSEKSTLTIGKSTRKLYNWINTQRRQYKKYEKGEKNSLTEDRINKLSDIGFDFSPRFGRSNGNKKRKASNNTKASKKRKTSSNK